VPEQKRFAETRSHWRNPMFPGDWGSAPTSKMSSPAYSRIAHFLQNFMKFALLADAVTTPGSKALVHKTPKRAYDR